MRSRQWRVEAIVPYDHLPTIQLPYGISTDTLKNLSAAFVGECHAAIRANGQEVVFKNWDNRIYCFGNQILRFISYRN